MLCRTDEMNKLYHINNAMKNMMRYGACVLAVILSASSCEKAGDQERVARELELTPDEHRLVRQGNAVAFELFKRASDELGPRDNIMLSPVSLNAALAMTANGAVGQTKEEMYRAMGLEGVDENAVNRYYQKLISGLPLVDPSSTLDVANSIWYREGFSVLPPFLDTNREFFNASVEALDFGDVAAPDRINSWVDLHTHGKIPSIVEDIPDHMVMFLINAVYFKGMWQHPFDPGQTTQRMFNLEDNRPVTTDFMRLEASFPLYQGEVADIIELPYGEGQYSMVVVKPKAGNTPTDVINHLATSGGWDNWTEGLRSSRVNLQLPKFKFSYDRTLNADLMGLGMTRAFTGQADFSRINPNADLFISEVKQKTFVEVNEEGTEAAAVTSVGVGVTSVPVVTPFDVDSPFLFVIRESKSGLILFIGQVNDPLTEGTEG